MEAAVASVIAVVIAAMVAPRGLGLAALYPHPVWLAVLVVGARYGGRGMTIAVPAAWGSLALAAVGLHLPSGSVVHRFSSGADLGALVAAALVSWIGSAHERRYAALTSELETVRKRSDADQLALVELRRAAVSLRARADRLDTSLTFLRDVSWRLDGPDPDSAAQAALDLATARLGARAAVVEVLGNGGLMPLASAGVWTPEVTGDRTAAAVVRTRRAIRAVDLQDAGPSDSDLAAPIIDPRGVLVGVLAVRGVPQGGVSEAALRDLAIIAAWAAPAVSRARSEHHGSTDGTAVALEVDIDIDGDAASGGSDEVDALEFTERRLLVTEPH
jgi:hypothetical protein